MLPISIIKLTCLPKSAGVRDIRRFFEAFSIPDLGVYFFGAPVDEAFVKIHKKDEDRALSRNNGILHDKRISLALSSEEMMLSRFQLNRFRPKPHPYPDGAFLDINGKIIPTRSLPGLSTQKGKMAANKRRIEMQKSLQSGESQLTFLEMLNRFYPDPIQIECRVPSRLGDATQMNVTDKHTSDEIKEAFISIMARSDSPRPITIYKDLKTFFRLSCPGIPFSPNNVKIINNRYGKWTGEVLFYVPGEFESVIERIKEFVKDTNSRCAGGPLNYGSIYIHSVRFSNEFDFICSADSYIPRNIRMSIPKVTFFKQAKFYAVVQNLPKKFTLNDLCKIMPGVASTELIRSFQLEGYEFFVIGCGNIVELERCIFYDGEMVEGQEIKVCQIPSSSMIQALHKAETLRKRKAENAMMDEPSIKKKQMRHVLVDEWQECNQPNLQQPETDKSNIMFHSMTRRQQPSMEASQGLTSRFPAIAQWHNPNMKSLHHLSHGLRSMPQWHQLNNEYAHSLNAGFQEMPQWHLPIMESVNHLNHGLRLVPQWYQPNEEFTHSLNGGFRAIPQQHPPHKETAPCSNVGIWTMPQITHSKVEVTRSNNDEFEAITRSSIEAVSSMHRETSNLLNLIPHETEVDDPTYFNHPPMNENRIKSEPIFYPDEYKQEHRPLSLKHDMYRRTHQYVQQQHHRFTQRSSLHGNDRNEFAQPSPPQELKQYAGRLLIMNNVPYKANKTTLLKWLSRFSPLENTLRIKRGANGKPTGCVVVAFATEEAAQRTRSAICGEQLMGRFINAILV